MFGKVECLGRPNEKVRNHAWRNAVVIYFTPWWITQDLTDNQSALLQVSPDFVSLILYSSTPKPLDRNKVLVTKTGGRVTHLWVSELGHHWVTLWLDACSAPSHYLNQYWLITLGNKSGRNLYQNATIFWQENEFGNVDCKAVEECVKNFLLYTNTFLLLLF